MIRSLLAIVTILGLVACGTGGIIDKLDGEVVVMDGLVILEDGQRVVYGLDEGTFEVQLTATQPVAVNWVGTICRETAGTQSYTTTCKFAGLGQLLITNPSTFGRSAMGSASGQSI